MILLKRIKGKKHLNGLPTTVLPKGSLVTDTHPYCSPLLLKANYLLAQSYYNNTLLRTQLFSMKINVTFFSILNLKRHNQTM